VDSKELIDLNVNVSQIHNNQEYMDLWKKIGKIEIRMVEQHEECKHKLGDIFVYETPYQKPTGVCTALLHVLDLYTWRVALGFPSWNSDDRKIHRLHCPDPKGTVWEMRKVRA
jgi:uncharacterized repeat protein (TIGR04076 family)